MGLVAAADHTNQPIFSRWSSPNDMPWTLGYVVGEARRIISYYANLTEEQRPPPSIWHSPKRCGVWMDEHRPGGDQGGSGRLTFNDNEIE